MGIQPMIQITRWIDVMLHVMLTVALDTNCWLLLRLDGGSGS